MWDTHTLRDGIEAAAAAYPDAIAVADDSGQLTWAQLEQRVLQALVALDNWGLRAGDALVLISGNTVDGVIAFQAALRAGVCVLVLDRRCGGADVEFARSLVSGRVRTLVPAAERERLALADDDTLPLEHLTSPAESPTNSPNNSPAEPLGVLVARFPEPDRDVAAVIMLTSGTTGRPKAVVHSLNTLTAGVHNMVCITGCTHDDALFLVSPLTSITGVMQMGLSADRRAALVMTEAFDPQSSLEQMDAYRTTLLGGAPVIAERILKASQARGSSTPLRALSLGGAMLPRPLLEMARDEFGIEVARVYGSSEAPNFSGSLPTDSRQQRLADDGALMSGSEVRVGSAGHPDEGLLRGPCLFLGYLDPADNEAAFEDDWYRTGDLIEEREGRITVTGRLKEVVNRNGLKISPSEIDVALTGLPGAAEFACYGVADPQTSERLAVAVRPTDGATVTLAGIVAHLLGKGVARRKLPEQLIVWDEPLPRTTSGKVVRSQLVRDAAGKPSETVGRLR